MPRATQIYLLRQEANSDYLCPADLLRLQNLPKDPAAFLRLLPRTPGGLLVRDQEAGRDRLFTCEFIEAPKLAQKTPLPFLTMPRVPIVYLCRIKGLIATVLSSADLLRLQNLRKTPLAFLPPSPRVSRMLTCSGSSDS